VGVPHRFSYFNLLPFLPVVAGLALAVWQFRALNPGAGLAFALAGLLLMVIVASRLPHSE
jgi:1,4-dihydroxy-2-naphthoate octaprenyltransferase